MTNERAIFILHGAAGKRHERLLRPDFVPTEVGTPCDDPPSAVYGGEAPSQAGNLKNQQFKELICVCPATIKNMPF
jgi:hypothetical protein